MGKKSSASAVSKISSGNTPAKPSTTSSSNKSSILKSAFAPSHLQLHLFASVIQSFESQQLRIHDTNSGRLRQQHSITTGTDVTCLDWGYYGAAYRDNKPANKKKRKRIQEPGEDAVIAYGTSSSEICMYSPAQGQVIGKLSGVHERGIKTFRFAASDDVEAWSIGGDGKLVQWDLSKDLPIRTISLPETSVQSLVAPIQTPPQLLCASFTPYAINLSSSTEFSIESFDKFKNPIHSLFRSGNDDLSSGHFLAADNDRYMNVFDIAQKRLVRTLVASSEVESADMYTPAPGTKDALDEQVLAVITRSGVVELFAHPFLQKAAVNGDLKLKRKDMTRKADAQIKLIEGDGTKQTTPVFSLAVQGPELLLATIQGGVDPVFQRLRWQDEGSGGLLFGGTKEVFRVKTASSLHTATMNGAKDMGKTRVDESRTVVANGDADAGSQEAAIEISSSEDEDDVSDDDSEEGEKVTAEAAEGSDAEMEDAETLNEDEQDDENMVEGEDEEEPTFGDLLAARHPGTISIADALPVEKAALTVAGNRSLGLPAGMSLGGVLSQALKTNDQSLLETCLHVSDEEIIQNTILRLDSSLAAILLSKLAERLADRPGRYGHLLSWVRITIIAHGGVVAAQSDVVSKLRTLYRVLTQRSQTLPQILLLKGKLDMLDAQQTFRRQMHAQESAARAGQSDPGMIYIEGQEDNWSSDSELDEEATTSGPRAIKAKSKKQRKDLADLIDESSDADSEDMPITNGVSHSDSEESTSDSDTEFPLPDKKRGILDVEAEVSGEDEEEDSEDADSLDGNSDEDDEEEEEEEDSSLADFINDDSPDEIDEEDELDLADETARKPATKRSKHR